MVKREEEKGGSRSPKGRAAQKASNKDEVMSDARKSTRSSKKTEVWQPESFKTASSKKRTVFTPHELMLLKGSGNKENKIKILKGIFAERTKINKESKQDMDDLESMFGLLSASTTVNELEDLMGRM